MRRLLIALAALAILTNFIPIASAADDALAWPTPTAMNKPWTRWWWLGSAVDKENLTDLLTQYHNAGMGGVEICPIYGAHGAESRFINYLTPQWMDMLAHTTSEGKRLDMGVDMTTGTGWPMGGPEISDADTSHNLTMQTFPVAGGKAFDGTLPRGTLSGLWAYSDDGKQTIDLSDKVADGKLNWTAPDGNWNLIAVSYLPAGGGDGNGMQVKRAAPGGEGNIIDPFSIHSMDLFLAKHDKAFADYKGIMPATQFHDSYEYTGNFTPEIFKEFKARRGYDLASQLPALMGKGTEEQRNRVLSDYRETMAELHTAVIQHWSDWAHSHGMLSREQAHGAPANILDLYGVADFPETETFGGITESGIPMNKLSSSAAHVMGKQYSSSESFTWLTDHFQASLAQVKQAADHLFLSGSNHILFHGMPYSPKDATWPGWLFYAAVNFNPNGGLWHDIPAFNAYVARVQSVLQAGRPSDDVLLYFPVYDYWQNALGNGRGGGRGGRGGAGPVSLVGMVIGGNWGFVGSPAYTTAMDLWTHGYGYDMISDKQLQNVTWSGGVLNSGGNTFHVIVVPPTKVMPVETLQKLKELAAAGAPVIVQDALPTTVPGMNDLQNRQKQLDDLKQNNAGLKVVSTETLNDALASANVPREDLADKGLRFIRRTRDGGYHYFIANRGTTNVDGWITLGTLAQSVVILDPMFADRAGIASIKHDNNHTQVYLQLEPGQSCVLRTFSNQTVQGKPWPYSSSAGDPVTVAGNWDVKFLEGGPNLPTEFQTDKLGSWTDRDDAEAKRFAGTASFTVNFQKPAADATDWLLDLGKVAESARVKVNGNDAGTLISIPFQIHVGQYLKPGANTLEVDVTNLALNRIIDMDKNKVPWKIFYNANVASHTYNGLFDASSLPIRPSGLLGPVTLTPMKTPEVSN